RTLAADVIASRDQPPFAASAMDGYAVRASDLTAAEAELRVVGEAAAGHPFPQNLRPGEAVRIFTGAPVPSGSDAIVIQEDAVRQDENVIVQAIPEPNAHVRPKGGDFTKGSCLLRRGHCLTSRDIMLAAANGETSLEVSVRPRVGVLATGDEVVLPGTPLGEGQIYSSVPAGLAPLIVKFGGEAKRLGIAGDDVVTLTAMLDASADCDVLVTIGGASVGDHDLVHRALEGLGVDLAFWKVAMRPGKPLMYGRRKIGDRTQHILGLPGNPVSGMICGRVFLVPLLDALLCREEEMEQARALMLPLAAPLPQNGARRHYMRGRYVFENGTREVVAVESQDSSLMHLLAQSDCLIVRRRGARAAAAGELVDVLPLDF
ncbi:MAG: molybdopterin molybdotransferase MoeA, partial [Hyphomicrobiaceae bacterium]